MGSGNVVVGGFVLLALVGGTVAASSWGFSVDVEIYNRFGFLGLNPGAPAGAVGQDADVILPGAQAVSFRVYIHDAAGKPVGGALLGGLARVNGEDRALAFHEIEDACGCVSYASRDHFAYRGGSVTGFVTLDYDADGVQDESAAFNFRPLV